MKKIELKKDTLFYCDDTHGTLEESKTIYKTFKAGTEVNYYKQKTLSGIYHNVFIFENGKKWEAHKKE